MRQKSSLFSQRRKIYDLSKSFWMLVRNYLYPGREFFLLFIIKRVTTPSSDGGWIKKTLEEKYKCILWIALHYWREYLNIYLLHVFTFFKMSSGRKFSIKNVNKGDMANAPNIFKCAYCYKSESHWNPKHLTPISKIADKTVILP